MDKFVAVFYEKKESGFWEIKRVKFPISILAESLKTQKPQSVFRYKGASYIFDQKAVNSFDKKGNPILCYDKSSSTPKNALMPFIPDKAYTISANLLDTIFHRGEIKAVVAGAWKANPKVDLMQMLLYLGLGGTIGYIVCLVVNHIQGI